jgi:hypothetical protein
MSTNESQGAGIGGIGDLLSPATLQKLAQMAPSAMGGLLQWALKSLAPVVIRSLAIELGSMGGPGAISQLTDAGASAPSAQKPHQKQDPSLKKSMNLLGHSLDTSFLASSGAAGAPARPERTRGRFYFLNPPGSESTDMRRIAAVAAKLADQIGIKELAKK